MADSWPADRVERWPLAKLVHNARNARTHSDGQIAQLAASIEEWGWTIPVLVDEAGGIIAGHGRVMAAHRLGIEDVPVMAATGWSDTKKRAYMLADNKLALNADWDLELLKLDLLDLKDSDFDLGLTGFELKEVEAALTPAAGRDGLGNMIVQFTIIFDDVEQQEAWFGFVRDLKKKYPNEETPRCSPDEVSWWSGLENILRLTS
jgi:ParB-like chromosome segregation protein Spo0J